MKPNIKDLSRGDLAEWLIRRKEPAYRAAQVQQWLFQKGVTSFAEMTNLPADLRRQLEEVFSIGRLGILTRSTSSDGTVKFLFGLVDGLSIESVLIPEAKRLTLCISTQVGCGLGCAFCATARMGLKRSLSAGEILEQILEARRSLSPATRITHLVLMGMGEPLANYAQTLKALAVMTDATAGIGISPRRITVSTVGLVPQMRRFMEETQVNLAVSLHAASDELRSKLVPVNRKYPLAELIECCRSLPIPKRRRITFEYVVLRGLNHAAEDARRLAQLLQGVRCKINLIPFNPHPGSPFQKPTAAEVEAFQRQIGSYGFQVNVRAARGEDIQAACGQLQGEVAKGHSAPSSDRDALEAAPSS